ncbi:T9SS type A sorting domain-containing protein [Flavobacterium sp.]|uniref:T9SS type A sorting domain-containing protein n=1 Tax=Flavobacterium sp. TaxID=239 RepID=UPI00262F2AA1|nr:T9SS type A sorting domain-containing protein [Flavobacterium sp.]MDD3004878.1 T9SS type A sorting domain-containing protein [Flavobacterium sp.]
MRITFLFILFTSLTLSAQNFEKDPLFNPFELLENKFYLENKPSHSLLQPDQKLLVVENYFLNINYSRIKRINLDNTLDTSFNPATELNGLVKEMVLQPDGKIILVGSFTTFNNTASKYIVRLNADGTKDTSFNIGTSFNTYVNSNYPFASSVQIRPDGKILVAGDLMSYNGTYKNSLFLLNSDGTIDNTFTLDSSLGEISISKIKLMNDGKIMLASQFFSSIKRINSDGTIDATFLNSVHLDPASSGGGTQVNDFIIQPDGKIIIIGKYDKIMEYNYRDISRINADGTIDTTFDSKGFNISNPLSSTSENIRKGVTAALLQPDGKIIISGSFKKYYNNPKNNILRLDSNGLLDDSFLGGLDNATTETESLYQTFINGMTFTSDNDIVAVGHFNTYNDSATDYIVRFSIDGTKNPDFNNTCRGFNGPVEVITENNSGQIIVSGNFRAYNGIAKDRIARLNADGSLDPTFGVQIHTFLENDLQPTALSVQPDGKIIVASSGRFVNGIKLGALVRLNVDGSIDTDFNSMTAANAYGTRGSCTSIALQPDGKILAAGSIYYSTNVNRKLLRLNADGTLDTTFTYGPLNTLQSITKIILQPDGKILVLGTVDTYKSKMIRLLSDGTLDSTFTMATSLYFHQNKNLYMSLNNDGKIILISDSLGNNNYRMFRLNSDGSVDTTFTFSTLNPYSYGSVAPNALLPNNQIMIGVPGTIDASRMKLVNTNGTLDTTFNIGTGFNGNLNVLYMQPNGGLLVGGNYKSFQGENERFLLRLINDAFLDLPSTSYKSKTFLYPNPTTDIVYFSEITANATYQISNLLGQIVQKGTVINQQISTASLQNQMYVIEIVNDNQKTTHKFLKQ